MNRLLTIAIALVAGVALLQWGVPQWTASYLATQAKTIDHGVKPQVAITAIPFWELAQGKFQDIYVKAKNVPLGPITSSETIINWQDGQVSVSNLLKRHRLVITHRGHIAVTIMIDGPAIASVLAKDGPIKNPHVTITPKALNVSGKVLLSGVYLPLTATGTLSVSSNRQQIIFHPTSVDGINLPLMTNVVILDLSKQKLPMPMVIHKVTLLKGSVRIEASSS